MLVKKLSDASVIPTRGTPLSAGLDLYSPISGTIPPFGRMLIQLDISIQLPPGTYGHILPRSGLALKKGIHVGAGVIDEDYQGNVGVLLFNLSDTPYFFISGDRIAQLVVKRYERLDVIETNELTESSTRGKGGYGSTGL